MIYSSAGGKMISIRLLALSLMLSVFPLTSCSPVQHNYKNISALEEELNSGKDFELLDIEKTQGGEFLYRIEYVVNGHYYALDATSYDFHKNNYSKVEKFDTFVFYYKDSVLYGVVELLEEENGGNFLINECLAFIPSPMSCFLNFNNMIESELSASRFLHKSDRSKYLLKGTKLSKEDIYEKEYDVEYDEPSKWHLLWQVPLAAFMYTPGAVLLVPPMVITEHYRESSRKDIDEKVTIKVGDIFYEIAHLVEEIPIESKCFVDKRLGVAYYSEPVSGNPVFAFGLQNEVVGWTRECATNAPTEICPTPQIPNASVANRKPSTSD
jgi:hypothetical protein